MLEYETRDRLYENPLAGPADVADFVLEGEAAVTFPHGRLRLESERRDGPQFVYWCPQSFPDDIAISWEFWPVAARGLSTVFFAADGRGGEDLLGPELADRAGAYETYTAGDIDALHASYYRRGGDDGGLRTVTLRKSRGDHLVARGADPIPDAPAADPPYEITVVKAGPRVSLSVDDLPVLSWTDDERTGPALGGGKIGFRQTAPLIGEYANLTVDRIETAE
ncbi:DUF1961 family protein [Halosimplex amylolyticum]|uniref:DUF1961 family protein n=1 Tax=Halosimplex amylolyticum TaxID=3396616 RepID=UPI003F54330D